MSELSDKKLTRRQILKAAGTTGLVSAFPAIVPSTVFGKNAPSNRINIGMIGMGRQAIYANTDPFLQSEDCQVVAVCDVDKWRLDSSKKKVDGFYKNSDCRAYTDWREVIARDDIDAIMNSTSDQWHVPISLAAVRKGKHVSCEKPLTRSIAEGRVLADAVSKHGVVFRTDSECRSHSYMHKTAQLAINGYLGNIKRIKVGVPAGDAAGGNTTPMDVPQELVCAIRNVVSNQTYLSPRVSGTVVEGYIHRLTEYGTSVYSVLTPREREVLQLIAEGKSTKVIAKELYVSAKTIEWHRSQLMKKLAVQSIAELVKYAINEGLTCAYA